MLVLANTLEALPQDISNCRVDASVDSCVLIVAWEGEGSKKSPELTMATKHLFSVLKARNIQLNLTYVSSSNNEADGPSRRVWRSDSRLSKKVWDLVNRTFGGEDGHSVDLMALDSNAMLGKTGVPLPHLSPHPSPTSKGTNLFCQNLREMDYSSNPYVFPPFGLVGPVLKFLYGFRISFTIVVPGYHPLPYWWPELMARCSARILLRTPGDLDVLMAPSKSGYTAIPCPYPLWACRVSRFS